LSKAQAGTGDGQRIVLRYESSVQGSWWNWQREGIESMLLHRTVANMKSFQESTQLVSSQQLASWLSSIFHLLGCPYLHSCPYRFKYPDIH